MGEEVSTQLREHLTSNGDEVRVLFNLQEDELARLLEPKDRVRNAIRDQRRAVVESGSARAA
jgi:hypothetical protein